MTQQSLAAAGRAPNWIADLVVGGTAALLAITVAQAALPDQSARLPKLQLTSTTAPAQPTGQARPAPALVDTGVVFGEPVPGYPVISPFGLRKLPWEEYGRLHQGVDIAAPAGLPVLSIQDGVITRAGQDGAYGRFVEVQHANGLTSFYAHLGGFVAASRPGRAVKRGEAIGLVGSTGSSTGAHLHIEVHKDERPLNPSYFIGKRYENAEALPFRQASYVPRRVRVAYVSFIPKSQREKMEAREEEKKLAALAAEEAKKAKALAQAEARLAALTRLPATRGDALERLTAMPTPAKPAETGSAIDAILESKGAPKPATAPASPTAGEAPAAAMSVGVDANGRVRGTIDTGL